MNIVWLKTGALHPLDTGGKIRTYNMLRELAKQHHITYLALTSGKQDQDSFRKASEYSNHQIWVPWSESRKGSATFFLELFGNQFSRLPYVIQKYRSADMERQIRNLNGAGKHDLIVCDFLTPSVNLRQPESDGRIKTLLFQHNVESLIWKRLFENAIGLKRIYFRQQWKRLEHYERLACSQANTVVGVSEDDCRIMRDQFGLQNVLGAVPTGVDAEYFSTPSQTAKRACSLVFLGSMDWMPNVEGIDYFMENVFPLVREKHPETTLAIVGRNPPQRIRDKAASVRGIEVTGTVADVRPWLAQAEVMVVPLRIGGGTRIKIFEGMAAGLPVVSTSIGAEGLPLKDQEHLFLADDPALFAKRICELFASPNLRKSLGEKGAELVRSQFSWQAATRLFDQYCRQTVCGK